MLITNFVLLRSPSWKGTYVKSSKDIKPKDLRMGDIIGIFFDENDKKEYRVKIYKIVRDHTKETCNIYCCWPGEYSSITKLNLPLQ